MLGGPAIGSDGKTERPRLDSARPVAEVAVERVGSGVGAEGTEPVAAAGLT